MNERLVWRPIMPFGAEVDLDLRAAVSETLVAALRELYERNLLLVFRRQRLTREEQYNAVSYFGKALKADEDVPNVSNVEPDGILGSSALAYHSDNEYCEEPVLGISLHAIDVEDDRTSTRLASGVRAYRQLSPALRSRISDLHALHALAIESTGRMGPLTFAPNWPQAIHPVAQRHPVTGEPILYVTQMQTRAIAGVSNEQSEALLQELFQYLYAPDNVYEHRWRMGDLLVWDNLALQHARSSVEHTRRTLQRVSLGRNFESQYPSFAADFRRESAAIINTGTATEPTPATPRLEGY